MSFKRKLKRAFRNLIGDFTGIQWRDLDHKKVYAAIAAVVVVIVLIIVLVVGAVSDKKDDVQKDTPGNEEVSEGIFAEQQEEAAEDPLEVDSYEEINQLVEKYFQGLSSGDTAMVEETVDVLTEEEKATIERKKEYIEAYNNVVCYTKKGLEEESFVVFAAYDMKIYNIETAAPGIMALYVCEREDGSMYIFNGDATEELKNYVLELAAEEEVAAVIAEVDTRYQQLITEDEDLGKFAETMIQSQETSEETDESEEADEPEAPTEDNDEGTTVLSEPVSTTVTATIRIREERSAESRMLDTIAAGTGVKVYENYSDGWSKIEYNGMTGYCKTEFLANSGGTSSAENSTSSETTAVNKQMQFKDTVRIRADRSTESARVATGYKNELVKVVENYSDGWSKINYNGTVGYCKTEFLEEAR